MSPMTQEAEPDSSATSRVLERNIEALIERRRRLERGRSLRERIADTITRFTGTINFVYAHVVIVAIWVSINVGWTPLPKFDPTFVLLATIASVEAIFLTAFVLMSQNRMQEDADRRADLDLQINLLTEHELTRLLSLVSEMAERMGVPIAKHTEELQHDVVPEEVLDKLEETRNHFDGEQAERSRGRPH